MTDLTPRAISQLFTRQELARIVAERVDKRTLQRYRQQFDIERIDAQRDRADARRVEADTARHVLIDRGEWEEFRQAVRALGRFVVMRPSAPFVDEWHERLEGALSRQAIATLATATRPSGLSRSRTAPRRAESDDS